MIMALCYDNDWIFDGLAVYILNATFLNSYRMMPLEAENEFLHETTREDQ